MADSVFDQMLCGPQHYLITTCMQSAEVCENTFSDGPAEVICAIRGPAAALKDTLLMRLMAWHVQDKGAAGTVMLGAAQCASAECIPCCGWHVGAYASCAGQRTSKQHR